MCKRPSRLHYLAAITKRASESTRVSESIRSFDPSAAIAQLGRFNLFLQLLPLQVPATAAAAATITTTTTTTATARNALPAKGIHLCNSASLALRDGKHAGREEADQVASLEGRVEGKLEEAKGLSGPGESRQRLRHADRRARWMTEWQKSFGCFWESARDGWTDRRVKWTCCSLPLVSSLTRSILCTGACLCQRLAGRLLQLVSGQSVGKWSNVNTV